MQTVTDLIDAARKALNVSSDAEFARQLGVSRGTIANWKSGYSLPDTVMCATLAGLTGLPLARVLGIVGEARAVSREEKAVWRKLAATAMAVCLAVGFALPHKAHAAVSGFESTHAVYIMRNAGSPGSMHSLAAWQWLWLVSVFLILVLLLRIVPLLDFIGNFEAFRDAILNKEVSAVAAFDPVRKTVGVRFLHGQVQFQQLFVSRQLCHVDANILVCEADNPGLEEIEWLVSPHAQLAGRAPSSVWAIDPELVLDVARQDFLSWSDDARW